MTLQSKIVKLIKLSDEHYIIVEDSKLEARINQYYLDRLSKKVCSSSGAEYGETQLKIIYSTKPIIIEHTFDGELSKFNGLKELVISIKEIKLSDIEELIYGYSVEKMALNQYHIDNMQRLTQEGFYGSEKQVNGYIVGFKAHQELVKDKLFTIDDMKSIFIHGKQLGLTIAGNIRNGSEKPNKDKWFNESIESLLPKTEWDIEIDEQGKMKLI